MTDAQKLSDHIRWIDHRGKKIVSVHYRGLNSAEMVAVLEQLAREVGALPPSQLALVNLEGATMTSEFMARLKQLGKEVLNPKTEKLALVGVTGIKVIFIQAYNAATGASKKQKLFANEQEAIAWLVE